MVFLYNFRATIFGAGYIEKKRRRKGKGKGKKRGKENEMNQVFFLTFFVELGKLEETMYNLFVRKGKNDKTYVQFFIQSLFSTFSRNI